MPSNKKDTRKDRRVGKREAVEKNEALEIFRFNYNYKHKPGEETPKMPKSLSALSGEKLSDLMNLYAAWREFTEDLLAEALVKETHLKQDFDFKYDKKFLSIDGKTVKEKEAKVRTDLEINELSVSLTEASLYKELLAGKLESFNNCLTVISREISRRSNG